MPIQAGRREFFIAFFRLFLFEFASRSTLENYVTLTLRMAGTASHSLPTGLRRWAAPEREEQADQDQEHGGAEGHDPENEIAMRQAGEEIAQQGESIVVNLGSPAVWAEHTAADEPGEHRNHEEPDHESEPEVGQLTTCARLRGE